MVDGKALGFEPAAHGLQSLGRETEARSKLLRRQPLVIFGRSGVVMHVVNQLLQRRFARRRPFEHEQHMLELRRVVYGAAVVLRTQGRGRCIALKRYRLRFHDTVRKAGLLREGSRRAQNEKGQSKN